MAARVWYEAKIDVHHVHPSETDVQRTQVVNQTYAKTPGKAIQDAVRAANDYCATIGCCPADYRVREVTEFTVIYGLTGEAEVGTTGLDTAQIAAGL